MSEENASRINRREFVKGLSIAAVALPAITCGASPLIRSAPVTMQASRDCEWCGAGDAPANPSARIVIPPRDEPGEPLIISGTVYEEDKRTPVADITIYAYHTNAAGIYPKRTPDDGSEQWRHGYLRGWMRTGADGKYEFRTIKPGSYPGRPDPAHIHMTVAGAGYPEFWIDGLWFEGDERITPDMRRRLSGRGGFQPIIRLTRDREGVWRGVRDIRLERRAG